VADPYERGGRFVTANGIRFHVSLDGDPANPVLALVNPASNNLTCWEVVLDELLAFCRVLRFDIRGTGKSGWGDEAQFSFPQYADDLAAIMDAVGVGKALVLGVAYGARTAARFALRHPDRLTGLALFDVALTPPVEQSGQRALGAEARALLTAAREAGEIAEPAVEPKKYWRFYEDREAARNAHTAHEREEDVTARLSEVHVPVLVACGRQDMNLAEAERIAAAIPGAQLAIMEMTGHGSPFFRPRLFVEIVRGFVQTVTGTEAAT